MVADSLKLAMSIPVVCLVAWSGVLERVGGALASTAAFLLYFIWPVMGVVMGLLVGFFVVRDVRRRAWWQPGIALLLTLGTWIFTWTHFYGWE